MTVINGICLGEGMVEISGRPGAMAVRYGGDVMNTAVYLSRLGASCRFVTALGTDSYSDAMLAMLENEGVNTGAILRDARRMPGLYVIRTDSNGERSFDYWRSDSAARAYFQRGDFLAGIEREMNNANLLYFSGITLSLMTAAGVAELCESAKRWRRLGVRIAFDPNYRPAGWESEAAARRAIESVAAVTTIALPTLDDDARLFGGDNAEACARRWRRWGADIAAVKCGAGGVHVSSDDFEGAVRPPASVKPVDTTGAGDSFNAGFLAALLRGQPPERAASSGNAIAGKVIQHEGAIAPKAAILAETV